LLARGFHAVIQTQHLANKFAPTGSALFQVGGNLLARGFHAVIQTQHLANKFAPTGSALFQVGGNLFARGFHAVIQAQHLVNKFAPTGSALFQVGGNLLARGFHAVAQVYVPQASSLQNINAAFATQQKAPARGAFCFTSPAGQFLLASTPAVLSSRLLVAVCRKLSSFSRISLASGAFGITSACGVCPRV
jgi:hypothetical protein